MKKKRKNRYVSYELLKNQLDSKNMSPEEYEKAIRKLTKELKI